VNHGDGATATPRGGGALNEITAPVIDDLGRRVTAATPEG
jgi:hypothetical protein